MIEKLKTLVEKHNELAQKIVEMSKESTPSRDAIRGEIYEIAFHIDDIKKFVRENSNLATSEIAKELIASADESHQKIFEVIRRLEIGRDNRFVH